MRVKNSKAFTLVEMMISLALFSLVAVVALGAVIRVILANEKAQTLQSALTNISSAMESMSREIRFGTAYHCDTSTQDAYDGASLAVQGCDLNNIALSNTSSNPYQYGSVIAFRSERKGSDSSGNPGVCNLVYIYRFVTDANLALHLQKGEQSTCGISIGHTTQGFYANNDPRNDNFTDILSSSNVVLTDYRIGVGPYDSSNSSGGYIRSGFPYPRVSVRLMGYAGLKEKDKTYFDVETTVSQRTPN